MNRIKLINTVSKDILENNKDNYISSIIDKVLQYDKLFDEALKNYYELKMDNTIPLFTLCEYMSQGRENYGMEICEYVEELKRLLTAVNKMFSTNYMLIQEDELK